MNTQEINTVFRYLLDNITHNNKAIPDRTLPDEIKEDIHFAVWMRNQDFSGDSAVKTSLRNTLQKQGELMSNASKIRLQTNPTRVEEKPRISIPVLISIVAGSLSILTATLFVVFQKNKKKISEKQTIQM